MDLGLADKSVYLSGAATGIGRATAELLAAEGARVVAVDINGEALSALASEMGSIVPVVADLSTLDGCRQAVADTRKALNGDPDIVINNAGIGRMLGFEAISDDEWKQMMDINFLSVVRISREFLPSMAAGRGGSVVNVTSDLAGQPEQVFVDYQAAKAALVNFSKTMAMTYAPKVRVNNVAPGPIWTPLWTRPGGYLEVIEGVYGQKGEAAVQALIEDRGIPLARMGTPEDVARAISFLASEAASYTTGSTLSVNGGTVRQAI
jgi:NAD(P)-dependent dehydrogenase (short-subunit alcohol dehydrogenase family)